MSIMHNGEKVLNNINTVPITQTIDASSTEKEIPSAKAVNTLLNNKANKMAMLTSQNIDDLVNEGSYYIITATNAPDAYGWVDVLANNDYTIQLFYPSITTNCEMYIRRRREGVWGKWQRVCTTTVANQTLSFTVLDSTAVTNNYSHGYIREGRMVVNMDLILNTPTQYSEIDILQINVPDGLIPKAFNVNTITSINKRANISLKPNGVIHLSSDANAGSYNIRCQIIV